MSIVKITRPSVAHDVQSLFDRTVSGAGFSLTVDDRLGIERLVRHRRTRYAPNPPLLDGFLLHKLRMARAAPEPAPPELVVSECHVTYVIGDEEERSGILTMSPVPVPGRLLVASLLGATLIGMRALQKAPLLRDSGEITSIVVLDVSPPPELTAA